MILHKKTNFRFSKIVSPGEPLTPDNRLLHLKIPKILSDVLSRTCAHRVCNPTTETSLWIATYTCHPYLHFRLLLLLQDTLNYFPLFRESFVLAALQLLFCLNTPTDNSSHLSGIRSSPVVHMSHKILWNTIRFSENPQQPIALEFLEFLHYG